MKTKTDIIFLYEIVIGTTIDIHLKYIKGNVSNNFYFEYIFAKYFNLNCSYLCVVQSTYVTIALLARTSAPVCTEQPIHMHWN